MLLRESAKRVRLHVEVTDASLGLPVLLLELDSLGLLKMELLLVVLNPLRLQLGQSLDVLEFAIEDVQLSLGTYVWHLDLLSQFEY